jgi:hypothetical protein
MAELSLGDNLCPGSVPSDELGRMTESLTLLYNSMTAVCCPECDKDDGVELTT